MFFVLNSNFAIRLTVLLEILLKKILFLDKPFSFEKNT